MWYILIRLKTFPFRIENRSINRKSRQKKIKQKKKNFIIIFYNINLKLTYSTSHNKAYNVTNMIQIQRVLQHARYARHSPS